MVTSAYAFRVKSYHLDQDVNVLNNVVGLRRFMITEMSLETSEFDCYEFKSKNDEEQLVFCIKEVKAMLSLCEAVEAISTDLLLYFCGSGSPIKFIATCPVFTVRFTLPVFFMHVLFLSYH